jgi:hypothetical protein
VPFNIAVPVITGTPEQGETLTANEGMWLNDPTSYTYQWKENGVNIAALSTSRTFVLTGTQVGKTITVSVVGINATGSGTAALSSGVSAVSAS